MRFLTFKKKGNEVLAITSTNASRKRAIEALKKAPSFIVFISSDRETSIISAVDGHHIANLAVFVNYWLKGILSQLNNIKPNG
jgi:hypothetical protein